MSRVWAGLITVLALVVGASEAGATVLFSNTANGLSASAYFTISAVLSAVTKSGASIPT